MNKQLFIVGLILVLFIVVFWKQLKSAFTTNSIENFSAYPKDGNDPGLMKLHHDFIVDTSTQYKETSKKIDDLVKEIMESTVSASNKKITETYNTKIDNASDKDKFVKLMETFLEHFKAYFDFDYGDDANDDTDYIETNSVENYKKDEDYQLKIVLYIGLQLLKDENVDFDFKCNNGEDNYYDTDTADKDEVQFKQLVCHFLDNHPTIKVNIKYNVKPKIKEIFNDMILEYKNAATDNKKALLTELLTTLIKELFTLVYSISENNVACVLHSASNCPNEPYEEITETDYSDTAGNTRKVSSATQRVRIRKFRCQEDNDDNTDQPKICAVSVDYKPKTTNCEVMNGYGKQQCENTEYNGSDAVTLKDADGNPKCRYDYFTEKCFNPTFTDTKSGADTVGFLSWKADDGNTNEKSDETKKDVDATKCHQISNKKYCNKQEKKCEWNKNYDICVPENKTAVDFGSDAAAAVKFCHSLSMKADGDGETSNKATWVRSFKKSGGGSICDTYGDGKYYYGKKATGDTVIKRKEDGEQEEPNVPADPCGFIDANPVNNVETQEQLCRSLVDDNSTTMCNFYKYPRYLPKGSSERHKYITKCVAKKDDNANNLLYSPEIMTDEDSCTKKNPNYIWSEENETCIKKNVVNANDCNIIKNSKICSLHSNCIWQSTGSYVPAEGFERGFCKDMTSKFDKLYKIMDKIHDKYLNNYVRINNIEEKLIKSMPSIKNQLALNT